MEEGNDPQIIGTNVQFMRRIKVNEVSESVAGLIVTVREIDARAQESAMSGTQIKDEFAELLPPAQMFGDPIRVMPTIYSGLRDWLNAKGANLTQHSSRRVIMTLASSLYRESENREAAMDIARGIIAAGR